jgi:hypothetical protein
MLCYQSQLIYNQKDVFVYMYSNHTNHMDPWRQGPRLPTPAATKSEARDQRSFSSSFN